MTVTLFIEFLYNRECRNIVVVLVMMLISWVSSSLNVLTVYLGGCPSPGEASCGPQSRAGVGKRPTKDGVAGGRGTQAHIRLLSPRLVVRPQRRG